MLFSFSTLTEKQQMVFKKITTLSPGLFYEKKGVLIFFFFSQKRSPVDEAECLTLKNQSFLMILKLLKTECFKQY